MTSCDIRIVFVSRVVANCARLTKDNSMNIPVPLESIDGFDPLAADDTTTATSMTSVLEEASKRIVFNILKSYTGYAIVDFQVSGFATGSC